MTTLKAQLKKPKKLGDYLVEKQGISPDQLTYALDIARDKKQKLGTVLVELGYVSLGKIVGALFQQMKSQVIDRKRRIGDILFEAGIINEEQLAKALSLQKATKQKIGQALISLGYVTRDQITEAVAEKLKLPLISVAEHRVPEKIKKLVPRDVVLKYMVLPIEEIEGHIIVAMADPIDFQGIDEIGFRTKRAVLPVMSYEWAIKKAIEENYAPEEIKENLLTSIEEDVAIDKEIQFKEEKTVDEENVNLDAVYSKSNFPPVVRLVASSVAEASRRRASDIHFEPAEDHVLIRFRVDGEMLDVMRYPKDLHESVVSRIKIISKLDITNRRTPQDGGSRADFHGREIDLRISTLPSIWGEKVVIRLLDQTVGLIPMEELGMPEKIRESIISIFKRPQGMLLVTGPTGSGKTTTLYACLNQLKSPTKNVITIEDPVEYKLKRITQVAVNDAVGRTFPAVLRSVLRQDPDVIMVGEIRDLETAEISVKAALTGHLVLTTMHTNDTISTITRIVDIGIPAYLVNSAVSGILAQRLIRRICVYCRTKEPVTDDMAKTIEDLGLPPIKEQYRGRGCEKCFNTGYLGRIAVYEYLEMTPNMRRALSRSLDENDLIDTAKKEGVNFLIEDGWDKVIDGVTTIDEVLAKIPVEYRLKRLKDA